MAVLGRDNAYTVRKFLVIDTMQHSLLSWQTCRDMNLLQLNEQICAVATGDDPIDRLLTDYADVFTGLRKLPGDYKIELVQDSNPIQVRPRKVPFP